MIITLQNIIKQNTRRGEATKTPHPAASLETGMKGKHGTVPIDAQHTGGAEEVKVTALRYPLLHNQDVPASEKKFPSQGQIGASPIEHVPLYGTYPEEVLKRQFTIPYVNILPHPPPRTVILPTKQNGSLLY